MKTLALLKSNLERLTCTPRPNDEGVPRPVERKRNTIFYSFGSVPRSHSTKKSSQSKLNPSQLKDGVAFPPLSLC